MSGSETHLLKEGWPQRDAGAAAQGFQAHEGIHEAAAGAARAVTPPAAVHKALIPPAALSLVPGPGEGSPGPAQSGFCLQALLPLLLSYRLQPLLTSPANARCEYHACLQLCHQMVADTWQHLVGSHVC